MWTLYGETLAAADFQPPFDDVVNELLVKGRGLYDSLRVHMKSPWTRRPFHILLLDDPTLNAFACKDGENDYILIHRGAVETLCGTFLGLLSTPDFLPAIGNARLEVLPEGPTAGGFPPVPLLRRAANSNDRDRCRLPNDQDRITLADILLELALEFLVFHEIGHILGGHLDMARKTPGSPAIAESHAFAVEGHSELPREILECDADAFACQVTSFLHLAEGVAGSYGSVLKVRGLEAQEFALVTFLSSVGTLFRVLYPDAPVRIDAYDSSYPHPSVRACIVAIAMLARQTASRNLAEEYLRKVMRYSIGNLEEVWAMLCLPGQNPEAGPNWGQNIAKASTKLVKSYSEHKMVLDQWARIPRRWSDLRWPEMHDCP